MTVWKAHPQPRAFLAATMTARHVGRSPRLVDEDQALRFQFDLAIEPGLPLSQDVGTVLLDCMVSFFARHASADEKAVKPGNENVQANVGQACAQLFQRDVLAGFSKGEDVLLPLFDHA